MMHNVTISLVAVMLLSGAVFAGALADDPLAYNDGTTVWPGSTPFVNAEGSGLEGYVDWAVYAPGVFPYSGYDATANEMVYAYQIFNTGTLAISSFAGPGESG